MHAVNEFVGAWWPVIGFLIGIAWAAHALWVGSKIGDSEEKTGKAIITVDKRVADLEIAVDEKLANFATKTSELIANKIAATNGALTLLNDRLAKAEGRCDALTPREDFHAALMKLGEMGGDLKAMLAKMTSMDGEMKATQRSVERVQDYLLEKSGK